MVIVVVVVIMVVVMVVGFVGGGVGFGCVGCFVDHGFGDWVSLQISGEMVLVVIVRVRCNQAQGDDGSATNEYKESLDEGHVWFFKLSDDDRAESHVEEGATREANKDDVYYCVN